MFNFQIPHLGNADSGLSTGTSNGRPFGQLLLAVALASLVACGGGSTESMLVSARDYIAKKDNKAAIIQIKNVLQKTPDSVEARYLMGVALLESGEVAAAEVELKKALDLKALPEDVIPKLAQARVATRQFKKVIDDFGTTQLKSPQANAELQTNLAGAYAGLGKVDNFQTALAAALAANPGFEPALIMQARQRAANKDYDQALASADNILAKNPHSVEAWRLKGDIFNFAKPDVEQAIAAYKKAIESKPDAVVANVSLINLYLAKGKLEEASAQFEALRKVAPNNPQTRYLQAQLSYQKKDFKVAREQSQLLLRMAPTNGRILQLAGAVEFQLNSLLQAEALLSKAVNVSPDLVLARRMLVMTYLRSGQPAKALATLNQGIAKGVVDPEINSIAGEVYLQNGDTKKAEEFFAKAAKAAPEDARKQTALALSHLVAGNAETGFGELQAIAANDKGITADMALISAHLRKGDFDKALKAIDALEKKQPDKPLAANLRGRTLLAKKDQLGARKSFEQALAVDPAFFPAVASLAALDLADKKPQEAKKRFEAVLAKDPKQPQALLAMAELAARTGAPKEEIGVLITKAVDANPAEPGPKLLLIDFYLSNKEIKQATSAAQNAVAALPDNPDLLEALGRVQQSAGEFNQAITSFNKLAGMQPLLPKPLLRLADAYMANKNKDGAVQSLKRALDVKPDLIEAQRGLIALSLDDKRYTDANVMARSIQKQRPKEAVGYVLEGDIAAAQKNWDQAAAAYRLGIKEIASPELAIKLHSVLNAASKSAEADKFSAGWLKDNPKDFAFQFYLGDYAIARKDYAGAEKAYLSVVKLQPNNGAAYNNLAWVAGRLKKPNAFEFGEKALALSPNQPAFLDTLAMLHSDGNNYAKALELQTKALELQPENGLFKLNLAKIHIQGGKKDLARKALDELAKLGEKFAGQAEVANLLKTL